MLYKEAIKLYKTAAIDPDETYNSMLNAYNKRGILSKLIGRYKHPDERIAKAIAKKLVQTPEYSDYESAFPGAHNVRVTVNPDAYDMPIGDKIPEYTRLLAELLAAKKDFGNAKSVFISKDNIPLMAHDDSNDNFQVNRNIMKVNKNKLTQDMFNKLIDDTAIRVGVY